MNSFIRALTGAVLLAGLSQVSAGDKGPVLTPKPKGNVGIAGGGIVLLKADLMISNLVVVQPNANYLKVYVKNGGTATAKNFTVRVRFRNAWLAPLTQTIAECKAGDFQTAHFHWSGNFDKQAYMVIVDADQTVPETNEGNNGKYVHVKLAP